MTNKLFLLGALLCATPLLAEKAQPIEQVQNIKMQIGYELQRSEFVSQEDWTSLCGVMQEFKQQLLATRKMNVSKIIECEKQVLARLHSIVDAAHVRLNSFCNARNPEQRENDVTDFQDDACCRIVFEFLPEHFDQESLEYLMLLVRAQFDRYHATGEWDYQTFLGFFAYALNHQTR